MIHSARIFILLVMCCTCVCGANANDLPDHMLTPGLATNITRDKLCAKTFHTRDERFVSERRKHESTTHTTCDAVCRRVRAKSIISSRSNLVGVMMNVICGRRVTSRGRGMHMWRMSLRMYYTSS